MNDPNDENTNRKQPQARQRLAASPNSGTDSSFASIDTFASNSSSKNMRHRPPTSFGGRGRNSRKVLGRTTKTASHNNTMCDEPSFHRSVPLVRTGTFCLGLLLLMLSIQILFNSFLHGSSSANYDVSNLRNSGETAVRASNSYDALLKNTIHYENSKSGGDHTVSALQHEIDNLRSQIAALEAKSKNYVDDPRFFPFVIRDSRHLTPVQLDPDFHVFDYVDLTQAKQPRSQHSQLLHNARVVIDEELEAQRASGSVRIHKNAEKYEAPCQQYSVECYRQKILQVFSYILRRFPSVEYYFYVEADNDLCVPMSMVKDLALTEQRYFINTGIGFSGWIMSRDFLRDFLELYGNATIDLELSRAAHAKRQTKSGTNSTEDDDKEKSVEIRPDVLASYYLTDKQAWTVTRQYWVSHTTLESLGIASLTVKDRRKDKTGERMKLDKHLPRCLEPRRGKWKVSRRKPFIDPRDRFGWDYFDYEVCPNELLFPCGGQDQLKELIAQDWKIANETGALARWKEREEAEKRKAKKDKEKKLAAAARAKAKGK